MHHLRDAHGSTEALSWRRARQGPARPGSPLSSRGRPAAHEGRPGPSQRRRRAGGRSPTGAYRALPEPCRSPTGALPEPGPGAALRRARGLAPSCPALASRARRPVALVTVARPRGDVTSGAAGRLCQREGGLETGPMGAATAHAQRHGGTGRPAEGRGRTGLDWTGQGWAGAVGPGAPESELYLPSRVELVEQGVPGALCVVTLPRAALSRRTAWLRAGRINPPPLRAPSWGRTGIFLPSSGPEGSWWCCRSSSRPCLPPWGRQQGQHHRYTSEGFSSKEMAAAWLCGKQSCGLWREC